MSRKQKKSLARILGAALLLVAALALIGSFGENIPLWGELLLFLPAYLLAGHDVLWGALRHILQGQAFDESFLMSLATVGAMAVGFLPGGEEQFAESVFVMIFYQTGELFQSMAVGKSRRSIASLMEMRPDRARVLRGGEEVVLLPEEVAVGEVLVVHPGEKIPLDGVVLSGASDLNTTALTGESIPRSVGEGDAVISGCTNLTGLIRVRVARCYDESTVSRILALIEEASSRKSRSERFITRFAKFYTPFVVVSALLLAFLPPLFMGDFTGSFALWLARALTFLVVSCPCALVISVPLSFFGGMGGASRIGVLIKGSNDLEALAGAEIAVFDKTGTLTSGDFAVVRVEAVGMSEQELLALAAAAETASSHPIAKAICAASQREQPVGGLEVKEVAGKGILARTGKDHIAVGNLALMREVGVDPGTIEDKETAVFVARNGVYCGRICVADRVKPESAEAVSALLRCGVRRTVMLTGDRADIAAEVAKSVGIGEVRAELLPADKVREVEVLLATPRRGKLLFVGDGINDAPVLARADVGVAMGALGSDAAIEAADVVLMDDDPRRLARAITHARKTVRIVRENIVLALSVKGCVLLGSALGLFGALQMPLAIFADVGVAVIAILNAMRALRIK